MNVKLGLCNTKPALVEISNCFHYKWEDHFFICTEPAILSRLLLIFLLKLDFDVRQPGVNNLWELWNCCNFYQKTFDFNQRFYIKSAEAMFIWYLVTKYISCYKRFSCWCFYIRLVNSSFLVPFLLFWKQRPSTDLQNSGNIMFKVSEAIVKKIFLVFIFLSHSQKTQTTVYFRLLRFEIKANCASWCTFRFRMIAKKNAKCFWKVIFFIFVLNYCQDIRKFQFKSKLLHKLYVT